RDRPRFELLQRRPAGRTAYLLCEPFHKGAQSRFHVLRWSVLRRAKPCVRCGGRLRYRREEIRSGGKLAEKRPLCRPRFGSSHAELREASPHGGCLLREQRSVEKVDASDGH